jgi:hypothetical protein
MTTSETRIQTVGTTATTLQSIVQLLMAYVSNYSFDAIMLPDGTDITQNSYQRETEVDGQTVIETVPFEPNKTYFLRVPNTDTYAMYMKFNGVQGLTSIGSTQFSTNNLVTDEEAAQTYARIIRVDGDLPAISPASTADKNVIYVKEDNTFSTPEYDSYIIVEDDQQNKEYRLISSTKTFIDLSGYAMKTEVYTKDEIDTQLQALYNYLAGAIDYIDNLDEYDETIAGLVDQLNGEII